MLPSNEDRRLSVIETVGFALLLVVVIALISAAHVAAYGVRLRLASWFNSLFTIIAGLAIAHIAGNGPGLP